MVRLVQMLNDVDWTYPRPVTTAAVASAALSSALLARAALPAELRPAGGSWVLAAGGVAYVALRLGAHSGWTKRFKHTLLDWFEGDVDDAQTWMLATGTSAGVLLAGALVQRTRGRPRPAGP